MKKVKEIALRFNAKGEGIVNYDAITKVNKDYFKEWNDNTKFAKKVWFNNEDTNQMDYKIAISSDLIRTSVFNNHLKSPTITHHPMLMCDYFSNIDSLLRGWMFPVSGTLGFKRKSPVSLSKLIQTNNTKSVIEIGTKRGEMELKDVKDLENVEDVEKKKKSKSLRNTETIGYVEYSGTGFIDIQQLQFLSLDDMFDRLAFNSDYFGTFKEMFKNKYGFNLTSKHYTMVTESTKFPEKGVLFDTDILNLFVRHLLKNLYNFNVKRNTSYVHMSDLEYKPIYTDDSYNDSINDENGWIKINNQNEVDSITFDYEFYYQEADLDSISMLEEAKKYREINEAEEQKRKEEKKEADKIKRQLKKQQKENEQVSVD